MTLLPNAAQQLLEIFLVVVNPHASTALMLVLIPE
jgi:hypothetical protein